MSARAEPASVVRTLLPVPSPKAAIRLFCFPYAGGGASTYLPWARQFPDDVEIHAVQLPGRDNRLRERACTRMEDLVADVASGLLPLLDRPYAFFGHSMGALVAFEVARALRRRHAPDPIRLFVSGMRAPQLPATSLPVHALPDHLFFQALRQFGGTPREVLAHQELMSLLLPMLRADLAVCETYVYQPQEPLDCAMSAYIGLGDHLVTSTEVEAWREHVTGPFSLRSFPGDHFFLRPNQSEPMLLQAIIRDLAYHIAVASQG